MGKVFYRLQMKDGKDGDTISDAMLKINRITAAEDFGGPQFLDLKRGDIVVVHKGAYPLALVEVIDKVPEDQLSDKSFGVDFTVKILSLYDDSYKENDKIKEMWGTFPPTGTFSALYAGSETYRKVEYWYNYIKNKSMMNDVVNLLKYKKQIILQGPPGTGKTRKAKEIANVLCAVNEITEEDINAVIEVGTIAKTPTQYNTFEVIEKGKGFLKVTPKGAQNNYTVSFAEIIESYKNKHWDIKVSANNTNGNASYKIGVAKYIYDILKEKNYKIIQFHPAYSYEDFVRGITAKTTGTSIEYKTEDKLLAEFAYEANKNYSKYLQTKDSLTFENWTIEVAKKYIEFIKESIQTSGDNYILFNSNAFISRVDAKSFKYNNLEYGAGGFDMPFEKFFSYCLDNKEDIINMKAGTNYSDMDHKANVGIFLMKDFWAFKDKQPPYQDIPKCELKNYVLIIDEINRANLPAVLGELIYALEYRGEKVESMYDIKGDNTLLLPPNLYIVGTMNTADRSVGHIDYAIRRRFAFVDVLPTMDPIRGAGKELFKKVSSLFIENFDTLNWADPKLLRSKHLAADFRPEDIWLGHSYFITKEKDENGNLLDEAEQIKIKLKYEIIPILKEYLKDGILNESARVEIEKLC